MRKGRRLPRLLNVKAKLSKQVRAIIAKLGQPPKIRWIRTGIHALDLMFGNGVPLGRIIEIYGDESTGKSLLGWEIAKAFQRAGGLVVVFDTEATAPRKFMKRIGLNMRAIIYRKPQTLEELERDFFTIHSSLMKVDPEMKVLYLHDSVAATSSEGEWEWDKKHKMRIPKETDPMGIRARAMSRLMRHITGGISESNTSYIAINQVRDKLGVMFGEKTTTPGGRALKFHSSIRLQLNRGGRIDAAGARPIGVICNAFTKKNKCAEPFRKAPLRIIWKQGFDPEGGLLEFLEAQERIQGLKGGRYKYHRLRFRQRNLHKILLKRPELLKAMY